MQTKPYTPQPDSDGRPERELADIWYAPTLPTCQREVTHVRRWSNHLSRDCSIVQALFMGQVLLWLLTHTSLLSLLTHAPQFKSTMTCACGHSSSRYEPFSILTVPLPEETHRTFPVCVLGRGGAATSLPVTVSKGGTVADVVAFVKGAGAADPAAR